MHYFATLFHLVLAAWPILATSDLNLLEMRLDRIEAKLESQTNENSLRLNEAQAKIDYLEREVLHLGKQIAQMKQPSAKEKVSPQSHKINYLTEISKLLAPRTCSELYTYGVTTSNTYYIDPDGPKNGSKPVELFCDFDSGATLVSHDKDNETIEIGHCNGPACFRVSFNYEADTSFITELIAQSDYCEQSITFDCLMAPLAFGSSSFLASWVDRNGQDQMFWHGNDSSSRMCSCGFENSCKSRFGFTESDCNCNAMLSEWAQDSGVISNSSLLPISSFSYGPLFNEIDKGKISVGPLKCFGSKSQLSDGANFLKAKKVAPKPEPAATNPSTTDDSGDFLDAEALLSGPRKSPYADCYQVFLSGKPLPGKYYIAPDHYNEVEVYCEKGGWTVIQSRGQFGNPEDYFYRNWTEYQRGFGVAGVEQWIGLDNIYYLTNRDEKTQLQIIMEDFNGVTKVANYGTFSLTDNFLYRLRVTQFEGTASDDLSSHSGHPFSTFDQDNDKFIKNCAQTFKGAWWYQECHSSNLNGWNFGKIEKTPYAQGIVWHGFTTHYQSLKHVKMMVIPNKHL